jgi:hypothetical protein
MTPQITTSRQWLHQYEEGRLTALGLILIVLNLNGKRQLKEILEALPADILEQLKEFVYAYKPGMKVFHGPRPKMRTVRFVKEWLDCAGRTGQGLMCNRSTLATRSSPTRR